MLSRVKLSVVLITHNEELNLGRTLESVKSLVEDGRGEIIVVDSSSTDHTVEIADLMVQKSSWNRGRVSPRKKIPRSIKHQVIGF